MGRSSVLVQAGGSTSLLRSVQGPPRTALTLPVRAVLDAPAMESIRSRLLLGTVLFLTGAFGCSSNGTTSSGDAGVPDVGEDAGDVPLFVGPGNLNVTWTINGNPPATECAVVGAAFVDIQATFGAATRLPCTQGTFAKAMLPANQLNVGARLLRADGSPIYEYVIPTTIVTDQTTNATINFEPPGRLTVRWTVNGNPPAAECATTTATRVVVRVERLDGFQAACSAGAIPFTRLPGATLSGLQPGTYNVTGEIISVSGSTSRVLQTLRDEAVVPSGGAGSVTLPFEAPLRPVDP